MHAQRDRTAPLCNLGAVTAWIASASLRLSLLAGSLMAVALACGGDGGTATPGDDDEDAGGGGSSGITPVNDGGGSSSSGGRPDSGQPTGDYLLHNDAVTIDGTTHRFLVVEPRRADRTTLLPIVVAYHGDGQSSSILQESWQLERATNKSALVIYPDGDAQGGVAWGGFDAINVSSPYVAAFARIVNRATQVYRGDASKVMLTGLSSGGILAGVISCRYSAPGALTLRATAIMSGSVQNQAAVDGVWDNGYPKCEGQRPVPTLVVHGDADEIFPADYGRTIGDYATYVNRMARAEPWGPQSTDGVNAATQAIPGLPEACKRYSESPDDAPVAVCMIPGMPHQLWDQSSTTLWQFASGLLP